MSESEHLSICTIHLSIHLFVLCKTALSSLSFANPYYMYCRLSEAPTTHPTPVRDDDDDDDDDDGDDHYDDDDGDDHDDDDVGDDDDDVGDVPSSSS